jgi:small subunit ribosomal protein S16
VNNFKKIWEENFKKREKQKSFPVLKTFLLSLKKKQQKLSEIHMLKLRLKRIGRKKQVFYKLAIMENLSHRNAKSLEDLGYYDPEKKILKISQSNLKKALKVGVYPTNTVRHLIYRYKKAQILEKEQKKLRGKEKQEAQKLLTQKVARAKRHFARNFRKRQKAIIRLTRNFQKEYEPEILPAPFPSKKGSTIDLLLYFKANTRTALRRASQKGKISEVFTLSSSSKTF